MITSISTTSATNQSAPNRTLMQNASGFPGNNALNAPMQILHLSSATTVYLVANATFTATENATGAITALRFR
ncbi:TPA: hypothetical protein QDB58_001258 [Burkholderia multivorans]|nr:hypothetical protein [Burkholderia multivorans]